jgi:hypothetical protein
MATNVTFFGWSRPPGSTLVDSATVDGGRLGVRVELVARDADDPTDSATRTVSYDLQGPGDAAGLAAGAVRVRVPAPGATNVDADKAVHAELAAVDLPWRHSLDVPSGRALRPWIVLLVGTIEEIEVAGATARVQASVLDDHPIDRSARQAHVELDAAGRSVARLISSRALVPDREHVAVIVPAYTAAGADAWTSPAPGPVELAVYDHWQFRTKPGGDFAVIARRLHAVIPTDGLGAAPMGYGPLPAEPDVEVGGALVTPVDPSAPQTPPPEPSPAVVADLVDLTAELGDAAHPVLGLPDHAEPWPAEPGQAAPPASWRTQLREDFRVRAVAGLGAHAGIVHQELLATEAGRLAGSYEEAMDRLRRLRLGLLASRSLWRRRMPVDPAARLGVLGPALADVRTSAGPVTAAMEHPERGLEASLFTAAAQRATRVGRAVPGAAVSTGSLAQVLTQAAAAPDEPTRTVGALAHLDDLALGTGRPALGDIVRSAPPPLTELASVVTRMRTGPTRRRFDPDTASLTTRRLDGVAATLAVGEPVSLVAIVELFDALPTASRERFRSLLARLDTVPDADDLVALAFELAGTAPRPVAHAFDLARAAGAIEAVFDPHAARPAIAERVLADVTDLDGALTADRAGDLGGSVELAPDLSLAAWTFLRDLASDWLLPGADGVEADAVVGLTTNPAFVEAFLLGLNAQLVGELRFRNFPLIPGWTPVRTFWSRSNAGTGAGDDDIVGIDEWSATTTFGDPSHQPPSAASADLVVLFHTPLFREYPGTVVSLVPAAPLGSGGPDWGADPDLADVQYPSFQGQLTPELRFFGFDLDPTLASDRWVMLEETLSGRRFFNAAARASTADNGADLAAQTVSPPRRVLIRGDLLLRRP